MIVTEVKVVKELKTIKEVEIVKEVKIVKLVLKLLPAIIFSETLFTRLQVLLLWLRSRRADFCSQGGMQGLLIS